jgi:hypothetical protein
MPAVRALPQVSINLDGTTIQTHGRVQYQTVARYLTDASGFRRPDDQGRETRYGVLSVSTNGGATYRALSTTSGAKLEASGAEFFFNGATTAITRNSLLRWCFRGDIFVQARCSTPKKVIVRPTIAAAVERRASQERVYGKAARVGGTATLQWVIGYGNITIASAPISSTGRFSFGFRDLRAGKYRVITTADASWGQGTTVFLVR